jgi:hypothetical protein
VAGGWGRLHIEELHNFYTSPYYIRMMKSGRMRWAGPVARMVQMINALKILVGNLKGKDHCRDVYVNGKITLE